MYVYKERSTLPNVLYYEIIVVRVDRGYRTKDYDPDHPPSFIYSTRTS